jgi:DNA processing protein
MNEPSATRAAAIDLAAYVIEAAKLRVLDRDWQSGEHHLDLVATPGGDILAAVEVRAVAHGTLETCVTAITQDRGHHVTDAAHAWIREHDGRYDDELWLIIVTLDPDGSVRVRPRQRRGGEVNGRPCPVEDKYAAVSFLRDRGLAVTGVVADDERLARAQLTYLSEPGDELLGALVRASGAVEAVEVIRSGSLTGAQWPPAQAAQAGMAALGRAAGRWRSRLGQAPGPGEITRALGTGIRVICPGDHEWPGQLDDLGDARPHALWLRGAADLRFSCLRSAAIVGARAATAYGSYMAADLAASVAARGWTVISGAAFGIDASAHQGALTADGVTVAVLACGVDVPYPADHAGLLDAVARQGVIASELPPGSIISRLRFLGRNRVIAALATGTVVVEAGLRSGAMSTAGHARDLRRPLMAVPGPVTSDLSAGCHHIIRNWRGALVTGGGDVIDAISAAGPTAR